MTQSLELPDGIDVDAGNIPTYLVFTKLKNIACRAIIVNGKNSGMYHIKPIKMMPIPSLVTIMRGIVDDSRFDLTDPDGLLKLEWPIMMTIESILGNEIIEDTLKQVDEYLERN